MIKKSMIITTIVCCGLISKSLFSQEKTENKQLKFIGIESGFEFLSTDLPEFNFIRGDISYYGLGSSTDYLETSYQEWYVGAKTEFRFLNDKCGVLTGFRYTKTNSYISKDKQF